LFKKGPYHESDYVVNVATTLSAMGERLDDIEGSRVYVVAHALWLLPANKNTVLFVP
jgi:hypothetical protein